MNFNEAFVYNLSQGTLKTAMASMEAHCIFRLFHGDNRMILFFTDKTMIAIGFSKDNGCEIHSIDQKSAILIFNNPEAIDAVIALECLTENMTRQKLMPDKEMLLMSDLVHDIVFTRYLDINKNHRVTPLADITSPECVTSLRETH